MISLKKYINLTKNVKNWPHYFYAKHIDGKQNPVVFRADNDIVIEVPRGNIMAIFKEIFMEDLYDIRFLKHHLKSDPVIVDIGANVGFFSLFMAAQMPGSKILAFEPLPANFGHLQRHFQLNADKGLICQNKAIAGTKGTVELYFNPDAGFTALASVHTAFDGSNTGRVEVEAVTLPDIFSQFGIGTLDLLKLDCEGAEYDILYRCPDPLLSRVKLIAMETHSGTGANENTRAMCRFLEQKGFMFKTGSNGFVWAWR